jgi:hypothetical protein
MHRKGPFQGNGKREAVLKVKQNLEEFVYWLQELKCLLLGRCGVYQRPVTMKWWTHLNDKFERVTLPPCVSSWSYPLCWFWQLLSQSLGPFFLVSEIRNSHPCFPGLRSASDFTHPHCLQLETLLEFAWSLLTVMVSLSKWTTHHTSSKPGLFISTFRWGKWGLWVTEQIVRWAHCYPIYSCYQRWQ